MPGTRIDTLFVLWAASKHTRTDSDPPFRSHDDLYDTIDTICHGEVPWQSFSLHYNGPHPNTDVPPWMDGEYNVWFRDPHTLLQNQLGNPAFADEIDYVPIQAFDKHGMRLWTDFMTGNWAWHQAV